jgi:large subunit ribosomal protein L15e
MVEAKKTEKKEVKKEKAVSTPKTSVKGFYHYIKQAWKKPNAARVKEIREKMIEWRAGRRIVKIEKPTRLDRARALGYKAKNGVLVFRVTIERGGRVRARPRVKRRSRRQTIRKILGMSYQWVAEQRVQHAYTNLEILNSYKLGKDGRYYFFEVIAIDPNVPEIKSDKQLNWICKSVNQNRALRGLTSSAKKSRGLMYKSHNMKVRPSLRSWKRIGK